MRDRINQRRLALIFVGGLASAVLLGFLFLPPQWAGAESAARASAPAVRGAEYLLGYQTDVSGQHPPTDLACRSCHEDTDAVVAFPSGETIPAQVDLQALAASAHGTQAPEPLACTGCHQPAEYQFPHPPVEAADLREYEIAQAATCVQCHQDPHLTSHPGPESETPVVCTDCHGSHDVLTVEALHAGEGTETCVQCHSEAGVELVDAETLTGLISAGLFAERLTNNAYCLSCHSQPGLTLEFENGEARSATIDAEAFHSSVHGAGNEWQELACTDCHGETTFPHEPVEWPSPREYTVALNQTCERCHEQKFEQSMDSVHAEALAEGNLEAAVCTDCHGAHDTSVPNEPRERISQTCEQCHSTIYDEYAQSVHGAALLADSNPDVATCIDCHGVHNINDPTTMLFRVRSPELCAECHADEELMAKYDISTDVFETYVADFHGTTIELFDPEHPNAVPNTAVCYDCHGVHDISNPDDPESGIKENLLETCQKCHPDATTNFPDAWTSHFKPSLQNNTLVYLVNLFYQIVIPFTLAFLAFLVLTDIYRTVRVRLRERGGAEQS